MKTFQELYKELLRNQMKDEDINDEDYDPHHLDCLLNPDQYAPVIHTDSCQEWPMTGPAKTAVSLTP